MKNLKKITMIDLGRLSDEELYSLLSSLQTEVIRRQNLCATSNPACVVVIKEK